MGIDTLFTFLLQRLLVDLDSARDKVRGAAVKTADNSSFAKADVDLQYLFNQPWAQQADLRRVHARLRDNIFGLERSHNNDLTFVLKSSFDVPPPAERFERLTLSATELFLLKSAQVIEGQPRLDEIAWALNQDSRIGNITITGYADRLASSQYKQRLSQRRADSVKNYLVSKGVTPTRLTAIGCCQANAVVACTNHNRVAFIKGLEPMRRIEVEQITIERRLHA